MSQLNNTILTTTDNEEVTQESSGFLTGVASYFTSIIPWSSNSNLEEWDTQMIDSSLANRLKSADEYLDRIGKYRGNIQKQYDVSVINTKNIEAQYNNNLECINNKVKGIRKQIIGFSKNISDLDVLSSSNEDTLNALSNIFDFTEKLRFKIGEEKLFKHIDVLGLSTFTNYYKAIELNKAILDKIATSKELETPLKKKLMEVESQIDKITKEIDLIKQFKIDHTKIITEKKGPAITSKVELLTDAMKNQD